MIIIIWEKLQERVWNFRAARLFGNYGSMATASTVGILAIVQRARFDGLSQETWHVNKTEEIFSNRWYNTLSTVQFDQKNTRCDAKVQEMPEKTNWNQ